ncbi:hypothetical protein PUN28_016817 [Cardiocondyla obscurior]|uniref:Uncharacterized protein n=1 Tax=Cardiocondyla obscurior TaxID=286306 RepID=A0AAW2EQ40_9HYME
MEGFRPLCGDNSSYTRYPENSLDEILEEALSHRGGQRAPFSSARDPWGGPSIRAREKTQHGSRVNIRQIRGELNGGSYFINDASEACINIDVIRRGTAR